MKTEFNTGQLKLSHAVQFDTYVDSIFPKNVNA